VLRIDGWKLDLSLFTHGIPPEVEAFQDELRSRLDDETRRLILRLKEAWHTRLEYPEVIGGFEICTAVLEVCAPKAISRRVFGRPRVGAFPDSRVERPVVLRDRWRAPEWRDQRPPYLTDLFEAARSSPWSNPGQIKVGKDGEG
jgi:hypothetical protein